MTICPVAPWPSVVEPRHVRRFPFLFVLVLASALLAVAWPGHAQQWERVDRLTDVRYASSRSIGDEVRAGGAVLDVPGLLSVRGRPMNGLTIGPGWISFRPQVSQGLNIDGSLGPAIDSGGADPRVDILSGPGIIVPDNASVMSLVTEEGVAIRWSPLSTPVGPAIVEILIDRLGNMNVQYLHLPDGVTDLIDLGGARALEGAIRPASASSFRHRLIQVPVAALPVGGPQLPNSTDPLPPGCAPEAETWCERADGAGRSEIYLNEDFNDGQAVVRGWTSTDDWHEIPFAICSPGATSNPGRSWYYGQDPTCTYDVSRTGSLFSPVMGPITTGTVLAYQFRAGFEDVFDQAEIYINGNLFLRTPQLPDSVQWYHWTPPLDLSAYAGLNIQIEFRFTSDGSNTDLGWMVDDVQVYNPNSANVPCVISAGKNGNSDCADRLNTQWTFYETNFCQGCLYTFYVLVECGREMHLPLEDMEGADIQITSMSTGLPVPLHCVNQTSLADAGLGPYRGLSADCCAVPAGNELWWGPAFDVVDNAGPGHVAWGFGQARCGSILEYDLAPCGDGLGDLTCNEIDGTGAGGCGGCGGLLPLLSPGENQTVDCSISDANGLCGLYRVDITSGGNLWNLFANCDGTNTPKFQIFHDCTEAWLAYNPLPELAISNLTTANGCPALQVDFDVENLGCKDQVGDVLVRLTSNCTPQETLDHIVPGPIAVGQVIHVSLPFSVACSPVRVLVAADPDNTIDECTENLTIASCRADRGVDSLAAFTCGCTAQLVADAGVDQAGCLGTRVLLDGSASSATPCANPQYRWTNSAGTIVQDWSSTATYSAPVAGCPGGGTYTLDVRCQGEACTETDTVRVNCIVISPNAGADVKVCVGGPVVLDGSASTVTNCAQREFRWFNAAGTEVRTWSTDPTLDLGGLTCANAGNYDVEVRCVGNVSCTDIDTVLVRCVNVVANAGLDLTTCDGVTFNITGAGSTRTNCTQSIYQWLDDTGTPISAPSLSPDFSGSLANCPGVVTLVLVAACNDAGYTNCGTFDTVDIVCPKPQPPVPTAIAVCGRGNTLDCGAAEAGVSYTWDLDTSVDSDANGTPDDDADLASCAGLGTWPSAGQRTVRAWATESLAGCTNFADLLVDVFDDPVPPTPTATPACPGLPSGLSCGTADPGLTYAWDADIATDSDADTVPDNDVDASACDTSWPYAAGSFVAKVTVTDARACSASATVNVNVTPNTPPGEVQDDRVTHGAGSVTFTWSALAGAASYRIARGDIGTWYSHAADDAAGQGSCSTGAVLTWSDPDDDADAGDYYYLITGVAGCGAEGSAGNRFDTQGNAPRDPRIATASCP